MILSSYPLILTLSLISQGVLLSVAKSIRKVESDDMLLDTFSLGKALRNGEAMEKSVATPMEHYKTEESNFLNAEEERIQKNVGPKRSFHDGLPLNLAVKQLPFLALKGSVVFPSDAEAQSNEPVDERRDTGDEENAAKFPIGRRDFDMLRCMLGRVYRPCWQI
ncbi:pro-MCH [Rhinatrema bivittatum]|uniref:pro-MCH n=1 Tax=Rhinatrema bivittatum TaxID=194408 RepID=UPI001126A597|nr:pro-MCH [Rhinatrema bivittatum]